MLLLVTSDRDGVFLESSLGKWGDVKSDTLSGSLKSPSFYPVGEVNHN